MDDVTSTLVATAIGSGALASAVTGVLARRSQRDNREAEADSRRIVDSGLLVSQLLERIDSKDRALAEATGRLLQHSAEVADLRAKLEAHRITTVPANGASLLEGWLDTLPWPCWVHAVSRNAWHLNKCCCREFSVPRDSFWSPINILAGWPTDLARKWLDEDLAVIESGAPRDYDGRVPRRVLEPPGPNNPMVEIRVTKRPWKVGGNQYVLGSAWLPEYDDRLLAALNLIALQDVYHGVAEGR